jgi:hypothetical protein
MLRRGKRWNRKNVRRTKKNNEIMRTEDSEMTTQKETKRRREREMYKKKRENRRGERTGG